MKKKTVFFITIIIITLFGIMQFTTIRHWVYQQFTHYKLYKKTVPLITYREVNTATDVILDTRSKSEYAVSHIQNAQFIDYKGFQPDMVEHLPKDQKIILYCSVGYRSERIGEKMQAMGFTNVHNLDGGIFTWVNKQQPIYQDDKQTKNIHPYSDSWGIWLTDGIKKYE